MKKLLSIITISVLGSSMAFGLSLRDNPPVPTVTRTLGTIRVPPQKQMRQDLLRLTSQRNRLQSQLDELKSSATDKRQMRDLEKQIKELDRQIKDLESQMPVRATY